MLLEAHPEGVRVVSVSEASVAEQAGLEAGDVIVSAAGIAVERPTDLSAILRRQAPGTLLPLRVQRDGAVRERLARFPRGLTPPGRPASASPGRGDGAPDGLC